MQHLFVYGTLGPGKPNEHILKAIGGTWEAASVKGYLKEEGWGAEMGYPGIILDDAGDKVEGYIFSSEKLEEHWDKLDAFEGEEYKRVLAEFETGNGKIVKAYIFVLKDM